MFTRGNHELRVCRVRAVLRVRVRACVRERASFDGAITGSYAEHVAVSNAVLARVSAPRQ